MRRVDLQFCGCEARQTKPIGFLRLPVNYVAAISLGTVARYHQSVITQIVDHRRVIEASIVDDQTSSARALLAEVHVELQIMS